MRSQAFISAWRQLTSASSKWAELKGHEEPWMDGDQLFYMAARQLVGWEECEQYLWPFQIGRAYSWCQNITAKLKKFKHIWGLLFILTGLPEKRNILVGTIDCLKNKAFSYFGSNYIDSLISCHTTISCFADTLKFYLLLLRVEFISIIFLFTLYFW